MITIGVIPYLPKSISDKYGEGFFSLFIKNGRDRYVLLRNTLTKTQYGSIETEIIRSGFIVVAFKDIKKKSFDFYGIDAIKVTSLHCKIFTGKTKECKYTAREVYNILEKQCIDDQAVSSIDMTATILITLFNTLGIENQQDIAASVFEAGKSIECENKNRYMVYSYPLNGDRKDVYDLACNFDSACKYDPLKNKKLLGIIKRGYDIVISRPLFKVLTSFDNSSLPSVVSCIVGCTTKDASIECHKFKRFLYCPFFFIQSEFEECEAPAMTVHEIRILNKALPIVLDIQETSYRELSFIKKYCNETYTKVNTKLIKIPRIMHDTCRFYIESLNETKRSSLRKDIKEVCC